MRRRSATFSPVDRYTVVPSPVGDLLLTGRVDGSLAGCRFGGPGTGPGGVAGLAPRRDAFAEPIAQLEEYFDGHRRCFDLELSPEGTAFQLAVWEQLRAIPYGQTRSYGQVAAALGRPGASRAVGLANRANPVAVIVGCHRVIGADGRLTGFAGGLATKAYLLDMEAGRLPIEPSGAPVSAHAGDPPSPAPVERRSTRRRGRPVESS